MYSTTTKYLVFILCLFASLCFNSCENENVNHSSVQEKKAQFQEIIGTYVLSDSDNPQKGGYLVVDVLNDGILKFQLDLNNGPPNYPSGRITGEVKLKGTTAVYTTSEYAMDGLEPCVIKFDFGDNLVTLDQKGPMSCGFGHGVLATGIYTKQDNKATFTDE